MDKENEHIIQLASSQIKRDLKRIEEINQRLAEIENQEKRENRDLKINQKTTVLGDVV